MKIHRLFLVVAGCILANTSPVRALDFTLRTTSVRAEALSRSATYITDGDSKIMLSIPNKWQASDTPAALDLIPEQANSRVNISQVMGAQTLPLDATGQGELLKRATALLPNGAKNVEVLPAVTDLLPIFHWTSVEFAHRYDFYGQKMHRSVVYINMLPGRVVQMTVTAPEPVFDAVHNQARMMMSGWFEPKRDLPPDLAREYETATPHGT